MKRTAFVSHYDCSRHDTGWQHPDHQGRLPALMRAVHADMLTLFDHLLEVEGRHATQEDLLILHSAEYLAVLDEWVADAARRGVVTEPVVGVRISGATMDAARAAVGCTLTAVDRVLEGTVDSAFCAVRPPGRYVTRDAPGGFGVLNTVATCATYASRAVNQGPPGSGARILVLELCGPAGSPTGGLLSEEIARVVGVYRLDGERASPATSGARYLAAEAGNAAFREALDDVLVQIAGDEFAAMIVSLGFDGLAGDPLGDLGLSPAEFHSATRRIRAFAEEHCHGRLVSILEGGYETRGLGDAAVQHLRALAGVDAVG